MPKKNSDSLPLENNETPENFEAALVRLEALVEELEAGEVPLEKSLAAFEEGQKLIQFCEKKLSAAEQVLKKLSKEAREVLGNKSETE
jgi:exodeoxyribonuclease VII small subunit